MFCIDPATATSIGQSILFAPPNITHEQSNIDKLGHRSSKEVFVQGTQDCHVNPTFVGDEIDCMSDK